MIDVTLTHVDAVLDRLAMLGPKAGDALATVSQEIAGRLRDAADRNLSGGVLEQRTGKLRASLLAGVERGEGGLHGTVTATAPYAAFQEYGFSGAENVRAYLRRQTVAFGHPIGPVKVAVRAFTRQVDYRGRSFLRAALAEVGPDIRLLLEESLAEVVRS
jgi:hypothetical protein